jgi:hypothetical protein
VGWLSDGVFTNGTDIELTRAWSITAAYEHRWNPRWKTSLYGGYANIAYNDTATGIINSALAAGSICARPFAGLVGNLAAVTALRATAAVELQLLPGRITHAVQPGTAARYRPRRAAGSTPPTRTRTCANGSRPALTLFDDQGVWSALMRWPQLIRE